MPTPSSLEQVMEPPCSGHDFLDDGQTQAGAAALALARHAEELLEDVIDVRRAECRSRCR